ncbi:MAG TPA: hypothetical protein PK530_00205 [Anaerolineales bacterium]|nr:hypothetical protein [Anaerolineales bacterium]
MEYVGVLRFKSLATKEKVYKPRFFDGKTFVLSAQEFKRARDAETFGRAHAAQMAPAEMSAAVLAGGAGDGGAS